MVYKETLERMAREMRERKSDMLCELRELPPGELLITDYGGYRRYMQRLPAKGNRKKEHCYGIKKKPEVLQGLIRKEYITGALRVVDRDITAIEKAIKRYTPIDENSIMREFAEEYPELTSGLYGGADFIEAWRTRYKRIDNYHPENRKHTAADGTKVRSKNELYIASRLDHYNIVYRSDCPTGIPGLYRAPDWTIVREWDRKTIYWEHCGMMDDPSYNEDNKQKLQEYEEAGIVPWDNLIVTYDTVEGGLRGDLVEALIKCWLL